MKKENECYSVGWLCEDLPTEGQTCYPSQTDGGSTLLSNSYADLKEATWWQNPRQASC